MCRCPWPSAISNIESDEDRERYLARAREVFERAKKAVAPIVRAEEEASKPTGEILNFVLD